MSSLTTKRTLIVLLLIYYFTPGFTQKAVRDTNYSYRVPRQFNDGIAVGNIANAGIDSAKIIKLTRLILADTFTNIHSLLIMRNGKLVYENYFAGKDQVWGLRLGYVKHDLTSKHDVRSISKSVVSACIGIAIAQKKIKSIDDPIFDYLPDYIKYKTDSNKTITIRNLLTMSSGIKWDEDSPYTIAKNDETQMENSNDPAAYPLSLPMAYKPGAVWKYNSGGVQVLAAIIKNATGLPVDEFAARFLFVPLGITEYQWIKIHNKVPAAASGLRLRSRDIMKIGMLYLNSGKYNHTQVIPKKWVKQSLSTVMLRSSDSKTDGYGYLFWTQTDTVNQKPFHIISARGNGGQRIFIDAKLKLIVVITAGNYNISTLDSQAQRALVKYILPAEK